jgi:hypothetical protein
MDKKLILYNKYRIVKNNYFERRVYLSIFGFGGHSASKCVKLNENLYENEYY